MCRHVTRDRVAVAAAVVVPLAGAAVLLPWRSSWPNADVALLLVVTMVAVAASGDRVAGAGGGVARSGSTSLQVP